LKQRDLNNACPYIFRLPDSPYALNGKTAVRLSGYSWQRKVGGRKMKHFTTEEWIDFVNQVISPAKKRGMEKHLDEGCKRCAKAVSRWQRVREMVAAEPGYVPPQNSVRMAKAAFAGAGLGRKEGKIGSIVEVLFDSFLQPLVAGARSGVSGTRQMLYRADPYEVHVNIEGKPESGRIVITGQLQDFRHPEAACSELPVMISNLRGHVVQTLTNRAGEFCEEIKYSGDLELKFPGPKDTSVIISLRDALGKLPN
jgi:hypothetical protein